MDAIFKLAEALRKAGAPQEMIDAAAHGAYDLVMSESRSPIIDLVRDCRKAGLDELAEQALEGEFDAD